MCFFCYGYGDHRNLHVLTHSFPTRRSSDLQLIASDRLPLVMKMEADRMAQLAPPADEAKRELQVVIEERLSRIDNNPGALFGEQFEDRKSTRLDSSH